MINSQTISVKKGSFMLKPRSIAGAVLALSLVLAPLVSLTAHAATGGPRDSYITLQTPILDASNTSEAGQNQGDADTWVAKGCGTRCRNTHQVSAKRTTHWTLTRLIRTPKATPLMT